MICLQEAVIQDSIIIVNVLLSEREEPFVCWGTLGRIGASLVPRPSAGGGKAWYTLFVHAPKFPDIPVIPWHSRILTVFELPECREISAHARTVCTRPSLPPRKAWERG